MNKNEINSYLKIKIPDYSSAENLSKHIFQFSVHVYPFIAKGQLHPFVKNLTNALYEIEKVVPGYSKKTIDWIAGVNKEHFEQVIQVLSEVMILKKLVLIADPSSIELEPSAVKNGKNPEFRTSIDNLPLAIEVKTASLYEFSNQRQTGFQITSQLEDLDYTILKETGKIINSKSLKVKDFLKNTNEKFEQYRQNNEYAEDYRLLFIIWDDYINEPLSALANPNCGLLTSNSFYKESNFENVDGVIVIRHIHQFFRNLQFGELVDYGLKGVHDALDYINPVTPAVYIQNPVGRKVPKEILDRFEVDEYERAKNFHVAEYQPTDFVDWKSGLSLSGLYDLPENIRVEIINFFTHSTVEDIPLSFRDISLFNNYYIADSYRKFVEESLDMDEAQAKLIENLRMFIEMHQHLSIEHFSKLETEEVRRASQNEGMRSIFIDNCLKELESDCPCNSNLLFKDCCYIKLEHYKFLNYYEL